jgi:hypothetical protein
MFDTSLLFNYEFPQKKKFKIRFDENKNIVYESKATAFGLKELKKLLDFIKFVSANKFYSKFGLKIILGEIQFEDKLSFLLLECICYYTITNFNEKLILLYRAKATINSDGMKFSPLGFLRSYSKENIVNFKEKFEKDIHKTHFRRLVKLTDNKDGSLVSSTMQDVESFLKYFDIDDEYRGSISTMVSELVDNAFEHGGSDCLIDIDVTHDNYRRLTKEDGKLSVSDEHYRGININIMNISDITIGELLEKKIKASEKTINEKHQVVKTAYNNHSKKWNDNYSEKDFFILSSFQYKITGRENVSTGGTGLTKLLEILEDKSADYICYMLSGNRIFLFELKYLKNNLNDWIGFNEKNDYINSIPDEECFLGSPIYFPGTAYNLSFILEN